MKQMWQERFLHVSDLKAYCSFLFQFSLIFLCPQTPIPSKAMSLLCITQNCCRKSFAFHYPLAIFLSVRFLNIMTRFSGTKTWNKFPVICLMQGLLLKAEVLKCRNLMRMLILMPFHLLNFVRNLHNLTLKI